MAGLVQSRLPCAATAEEAVKPRFGAGAVPARHREPVAGVVLAMGSIIVEEIVDFEEELAESN